MPIVTLERLSMQNGKTEIRQVPLEALIIDEAFNARDYNIKDNKDHVAALAESIRVNGLRKPITVRKGEADGTFFIVDGHSRYHALRAIDFKGTIPIYFEPGREDETSRTLGLLVNNEGKPLSALEKASVFYRLKGLGMNGAEIAKRTQQSEMLVSNYIRLWTVPSARACIVAGLISATDAVEIIRQLPKEKAQETYFKKKLDSGEKFNKSDLGAEKQPVPEYMKRKCLVALLNLVTDMSFDQATPPQYQAAITDLCKEFAFEPTAWYEAQKEALQEEADKLAEAEAKKTECEAKKAAKASKKEEVAA